MTFHGASENLLADLLAPGRSFSRSRSLVGTQMKVNSQARQEVSFVANSATTETTKSNSSAPDPPRARPGRGESHASDEAVETFGTFIQKFLAQAQMCTSM